MDISKFNEKLNELEGNTYVIEEIVNPINSVYEAELAHDNVNLTTLNIYTGSKLTGDKINSYTISTPSLTPWKTSIKIFSDISPLYISYETSGDTVEAGDINKLQEAVISTQSNLNVISENFDLYKIEIESELAQKSESINVYSKEEINNILTALGSGDMTKAIYDADNDGIVDKAKKIVGPITWNDLEGV